MTAAADSPPGAVQPEPGDGLPQATSRRWQPLRGGLTNLYRFDHEEFHYEQGRLLLRGNNGTGKSRVLALQLPFLLDGEVSPHRLEPDGDPAKRIEWNLLLGKHNDRLGYTWLELGRRDNEGCCHYLTIGCGLHAIAGRGIAGRWFFVTGRRIGQDLFLQADAGYPLNRTRLTEALGDNGTVLTTAAEYRRLLNQTLFKLDERRYTALVNLLIQLRQPQLSRKLDEHKLSNALSEALPPVSPSIIADVAESFRSLEQDRSQLEGFREAQRGAETFLTEYRRYAQVATRRRAAAVRSSHADYESAMRRLRAAEAELGEAEQALQAASQLADRLAVQERAATAEVEALANSPQIQDARTLDRARLRAGERRDEAALARAELTQAEANAETMAQQLQAATGLRDETRQAVEASLQEALAAARSLGLEQDHHQAMTRLGLPELRDTEVVRSTRNQLEQVLERCRQACRHLRRLDESVAAAGTALGTARQVQESLAAQVDDALELQTRAHEAAAAEEAALVAGYQAWCTGLRELQPSPAAVIAELLPEWCRSIDGKSPVVRAAQEALRKADQQLTSQRLELEQRQAGLAETIQTLDEERTWLAAGSSHPPPVPLTRGEQVRDGQPGAPLWALCEPAAHLEAPQLAGLEAALQASGLLDARVLPGGHLLGPQEHDTILVAGTSPPAPADQHLGLALVPAVDEAARAAGLDEETVAAVLRHIGLGPAGPVWVADDGRWQAGPAHGAWRKPAAQHLGRQAREAERQRRLQQVETELGAARLAMDQLASELEGLARRRRTALQEAEQAPSDEPVRQALADAAAARELTQRQRDRLAEAEAVVAARRRDLAVASEALQTAAADLGLAAWVDDLAGLEEALAGYRHILAELWPTARRLVEVTTQVAEAEARASAARDELAHRRQRAQTATQAAEAAAVECDTLQQAVGAAVEEILARLETARRRAEQARAAREQALEQRTQTYGRVERARGRIEAEQASLERAEQQRQQAIDAVRQLVATRLLGIALPEHRAVTGEGWSITRSVELCRSAEASLERISDDDAAWDRVQRSLHRYIQELTSLLQRHQYQPVVSLEHGLLVVSVPFHGRECTVAELRDSLAAEVATRQSVLDAREREILENHLIGEVALHLHDRLRDAERLVQEMNQELRSRPMSTGMALRFRWLPIDDGPTGVVDARRRLLGAASTWSPAEREAVGLFLQQQIQAVRTASETGTWQEHLATALDYRSWHRFFIERQQDNQWHRLTRRTHGTGSGGEKAIALTMPQLAAVAAHYRTADALAPRLILLDEAFVGVDADMRAKCMGLLNAFDLDFVMTSEREWGCYATLPGVAIYQLATRPGIDAVGISRWVWNGRERQPRERQVSPASPPLGAERSDGET